MPKGLPPFTAAELRAPIRLPDSVEPGMMVEPMMRCVTTVPEWRPLEPNVFEDLDIEHRVEIRLYEEDVACPELRRHPTPAGRARWKRLASLPHMRTAYSDEVGCTGAIVGFLEIVEYPDHLRAYNGATWSSYLDGRGADYGRVADTMLESCDYGVALIGGSLFVFSSMHVHPAFRGQHIGARLLAHALTIHVHNEADVALLAVMPIKSEYDSQREEATPLAIRALARYYGRCGFKQWTRRGPSRTCPIMYYLGQNKLPFEDELWWDYEKKASRKPA